MKNFQHWSTETLESRKSVLYSDIAQYESLLVNAKSFLYRMSLGHYIKKAKEEIHAIDAELCYREHNG
jgi:hypothetical protein